MKSTQVETLMGAVVVAVAALFFLFAYETSGKGAVRGGYHLIAEFDNAEGVNVGTDVRMAGIKIGTVVATALNPDNYQARVTMQVIDALKLKDDATAKVSAEGLLGSKFIALEQGGSDTVLADNGVISNTQGAVDIWSLISQAMFDKGKGGGSASPPASSGEAPAPANPPAGGDAPAPQSTTP